MVLKININLIIHLGPDITRKLTQPLSVIMRCTLYGRGLIKSIIKTFELWWFWSCSDHNGHLIMLISKIWLTRYWIWNILCIISCINYIKRIFIHIHVSYYIKQQTRSTSGLHHGDWASCVVISDDKVTFLDVQPFFCHRGRHYDFILTISEQLESAHLFMPFHA